MKEQPMSSARNSRIARNTLFLSLRMVVVLLVSLYTSRVFLHVLGVEDYGVANVVAGFVSMFTFLNTALANSIQRYFSYELGVRSEGGITKVYSMALVIQVGLAVAVAVLLESVGYWYIVHKLVIPADRMSIALWVYHLTVLSTILVIVKIPYDAVILAYERMDYYAFVNVLDALLKLVFALVLPYLDADKLLLYGVFYLLIASINFLLNFVYAKKSFRELVFHRTFHRQLFKNMLSFSGWNFAGTFACMMREQGLNLILNFFFGPVVNAARAVAYQVSSALQGFVQNLSIAAKPQMIQSYAEGNERRTVNLMYTMSKLSFMFLFLLSLPIVLEIDFVLHLWLGGVIPAYTGQFVLWVVLVSFVNNLNAPLSNVVYATGRMRNYELTFCAFNVAILPVSYFILRTGAPPVSVFMVYFVLMVLAQVGCLLVLRTLVSISLREYIWQLVWPLMRSSLASILLPLVLFLSLEPGAYRVAVVTIAAIIPGTLIFFAFGLNSQEKKMVTSMIATLMSKIRNR